MKSYDTLAAECAAARQRYEDLKQQTQDALFAYLDAGKLATEAFEKEHGSLPSFLSLCDAQRAGLAQMARA